MIDLTNFNRRIVNTLCICARKNGGEVHGSVPAIAVLVLEEMNGAVFDESLKRMRDHLHAVGFEHLTEGSPLVYFLGPNNVHHFVLQEALNEPE